VSFERDEVPFVSVETNGETKAVAEAVQKLGRESSLDEVIERIDAVSADEAFDLLSGDLHASAVVAAYGNTQFCAGCNSRTPAQTSRCTQLRC